MGTAMLAAAGVTPEDVARALAEQFDQRGGLDGARYADAEALRRIERGGRDEHRRGASRPWTGYRPPGSSDTEPTRWSLDRGVPGP